MKAHPEPEQTACIDRALAQFFARGNPEPDFVARLERQLRMQAMAQERQRITPDTKSLPGWSGSFPRHSHSRWALAVLLTLVVTALSIFAFGPERVWAQIQHLLGYVPRGGLFVNEDQTRVLAAPVQISQDGLIITLDQVVAEPHQTTVWLHYRSQPPWPRPDLSKDSLSARLVLPDAQEFIVQNVDLVWGSIDSVAWLEFAPLPADLRSAELVIDRLPGAHPQGEAFKDWRMEFALSGGRNDKGDAVIWPVYSPANANDSHEGVALHVMDVAQTPDETVVRIQAQWTDPCWAFAGLGTGTGLPQLHDDLGQRYGVAPARPGQSTQVRVDQGDTWPSTCAAGLSGRQGAGTADPSVYTATETFSFAAVSPQASQLTLSVDEVAFDVKVAERFILDVGSTPQLYEVWPLNVRLDLAGFPLHVDSARLLEQPADPSSPLERRYALHLEMIAPITPAGYLDFVSLAGPEGMQGGDSFRQAESVRMNAVLDFGNLPTGEIEIDVNEARARVRRPWKMTWEVPVLSAKEGP